MFCKRWYDQNPTLSIAVSLLQNTSAENRDKIIALMTAYFEAHTPEVLQKAEEAKGGWLWFIQRRHSMNQGAWQAVETMQFLSEDSCRELALAMIKTIYMLENDQGEEFDLGDLSLLELAV